MSDVIRQHIAQLRNEVEKRYREGLDAIKRLEQTLIGGIATQESLQPQGPLVQQIARTVVGHVGKNGSQIDVVLAALRESPKTINQLAAALPEMTPIQIRAVLYSNRIKKQVKKTKTANGIRFSLKLSAKKLSKKRAVKPNSTSSLVLDLISENPTGMTSSEIGDALIDKIDSDAKNKRNTISSALYNLKQAGTIHYDFKSKKYAPATTPA